MNNTISNKRTYIPPIIDKITIDNEISLALESEPPGFPGEEDYVMSESYNTNPFNTENG